MASDLKSWRFPGIRLAISAGSMNFAQEGREKPKTPINRLQSVLGASQEGSEFEGEGFGKANIIPKS